MKNDEGWYWPDTEQHMLDWMRMPKNHLPLNGRPSYQGKKQVAAINLCERRRTAIDVGAHIGMWSFNLAEAFGCVRAFEPVALHRECFALNVPQQNVVLYPLALGTAHAMVTMHTGPSSTGDTWVDPSKAGGTVSMVPLDDLEFTEVDFIKIDCEGYEEHVLRGAEQTLRSWRPVVCVEQKRDMAVKFGCEPKGGVRFLESLGYVQHVEIGGDHIMRMPD